MSSSESTPIGLPPRAFSIDEFCRRYGIGRTTSYAEIAAGRLRCRKVGKRSLITEDDAEAWLESLQCIGAGGVMSRTVTEQGPDVDALAHDPAVWPRGSRHV
jgi:excisionase family DNA binding protein